MYVLANSFSLPETIGMISESVLTHDGPNSPG